VLYLTLDNMDALTFLSIFANRFPDDPNERKNPEKNAVIILLIRIGKTWRLVMNVERRGATKHVWGFPGGGIDAGEKPWNAALRELKEETGIVFNKKRWDHKSEHKFTRRGTRFYIGIYNGSLFKGNPRNKEVSYVEWPRIENFYTALSDGHGSLLTCGKFTLPMRNCMHSVLG
jgi:8-oxo-dGTP pyrophosphatase MutT (NUDIX family)